MAPSNDRVYHVVYYDEYEGNLPSDIFGIMVSLHTYSHLSFIGSTAFSDTYADMYLELRQSEIGHPVISKLFPPAF
jgi:hypothetical protein